MSKKFTLEIEWHENTCRICQTTRMIPTAESWHVAQRILGVTVEKLAEMLSEVGTHEWPGNTLARWKAGTAPDERAVEAFCKLLEIERPSP